MGPATHYTLRIIAYHEYNDDDDDDYIMMILIERFIVRLSMDQLWGGRPGQDSEHCCKFANLISACCATDIYSNQKPNIFKMIDNETLLLNCSRKTSKSVSHSIVLFQI